jgi:hypothetical protein
MTLAVHAPTMIQKRSGEVVPFDSSKIASALSRCFLAMEVIPQVPVDELVIRVVNIVWARWADSATVEQVQDIVEMVLQAAGEYAAAKRYILYRAEHERQRVERPIPDEVRAAFELDRTFFPTQLQRFQFYDKYARFSYEHGRRETYVEAVDRVINQLRRLVEMNANPLPPDLYERIRTGMLEMRAMPSMRLLSMAGPAFERDNSCMYNCVYEPIDGIEAWVEAMWLSMAGCGVGFSVEQEYVEQFPRVQRQLGRAPELHVVEDSSEGWCDALRRGCEAWFNGGDVRFDYTLIRPAGAILRIKGGRASGSAPLKRLLDFTRARILSRQGTTLRTIDAHDITCAVGSAAVSGGVRRTAMISIFDADDGAMLTAKSGDFERENNQRWNANNSAVWDNVDNLTQDQFIGQFMEMVRSGRGEPGIFNREAARNLKPERRASNFQFGSNPCFHPDTLIETAYGPKRIEDITQPTWVYSMAENGSLCLKRASASWKTRENAETLAITTVNGKTLIVTPEHKIFIDGRGWVEARDVRVKDRVVALLRKRRGAKYVGVRLTTETQMADERMEHVFIWEGIHGKKPEGHDIHHVDTNTYHNSLDNFELLTHSEHARLTRLSNANNHQVRGDGGRFISGPESRRGVKAVLDVPVEMKAGFHQYATVVAISAGPTTDVYDIQVEDTHNVVANGMVAHNCGEIVLRPWQMCNLTAAVARRDDTYDTLREKVELAAIIGTIQSLGTYFPTLRPQWKQNCDEERLLGVDITGQLDCPLLTGASGGEVMHKLKRVAVETNVQIASMLGINRSASVTTVKPSGNISQLLDCASGIHARWAPYYIRNVRVSASSALAKVLRDSGAPMQPENGDDPANPHTWVVSFPVKAPDGSITRSVRTAIDQCNYWLRNKRCWTEHNPSVTITYKPDEVIDVMRWVWNHRHSIGGMAFLPDFDAKYDQLPYIEIDQTEYEQRVAEFPEIDFVKVYRYESEDWTIASQLPSCDGPICAVDE